MREFTTAVTQAHGEEPEEGKTLTIDGQDYTYYQPTDGQILMFVSAALGKHASQNDAIAGTVDFFLGLFEENDAAHLAQRLMKRSDPFGIEAIDEILEEMITEWTGRPIKLPSDYAQSRKPGGQRSTQRTRRSTSSGSPSTVS